LEFTLGQLTVLVTGLKRTATINVTKILPCEGRQSKALGLLQASEE